MDAENFQLSNLILKNTKAMRAVYEYYGLQSDLLEFAKNAEIGADMLPPPPKPPNLTGITDPNEIEKMTLEFNQLNRMWEDQKQSYTMHVPYGDYIMIQNYLAKYYKTLFSTPAVKGNRFYAFTKNVEHQEQGGLGGFLKKNREQPQQ